MSQSQIGNTALISRLNKRLVLHAVRVMQPTFRAEVARKTGLKPATVTSIVNLLIDQQLLREVPGTTDDGARFGRPPLMLEVNCDIKRILAIDLEPDRVRATLTDLRVNILAYHEENIDRFETRKVVFHCPGALENTETAFLKAVEFELMWLKNKKGYYGLISREDDARLAMMEERYRTSIDAVKSR